MSHAFQSPSVSQDGNERRRAGARLVVDALDEVLGRYWGDDALEKIRRVDCSFLPETGEWEIHTHADAAGDTEPDEVTVRRCQRTWFTENGAFHCVRESGHEKQDGIFGNHMDRRNGTTSGIG